MAKKTLSIDGRDLTVSEIADFVFNRESYERVVIDVSCLARVEACAQRFQSLLDQGLPIYGVTTGFGDSCFRTVDRERSSELQANLVSYLLCGTGENLSREASRATALIRLQSMCRGFSGVSTTLVERMRLYLEKDWIPVVPREGSLGASGDLIPLAYLAQILQGEGRIHDPQLPNDKSATLDMRGVLERAGLDDYRLQPKEGLALVNGTSTMAGLYLQNLVAIQHLAEMVCLSTGWLCLALNGRTEAFGELINARSKTHPGQTHAARLVRRILDDENYRSTPLNQISISADRHTSEFIQDRYSLRCTPQVMGPIFETLELAERWLTTEINSASDNPLVDEEGGLHMGGNFYGGHLAHGMDYLKICVAHMADLIDRQLMTLMDDKSNRGLPANLANWPGIKADDRFLHHGLKGLHQAVSAITSEIMARTMPNGVFSRSSESHNQDKVSLGMSAAVQCSQMVAPLHTITAMYLTCLCQALDLRGIKLKGSTSRGVYVHVRRHIEFVTHDQALGERLRDLTASFVTEGHKQGKVFNHEKA